MRALLRGCACTVETGRVVHFQSYECTHIFESSTVCSNMVSQVSDSERRGEPASLDATCLLAPQRVSDASLMSQVAL